VAVLAEAAASAAVVGAAAVAVAPRAAGDAAYGLLSGSGSVWLRALLNSQVKDILPGAMHGSGQQMERHHGLGNG
jgi:hypothetical protein